jgi:hypothetical protein
MNDFSASRVRCDVIIDAPIDHVWAILTDLAAYHSWHPSTRLVQPEEFSGIGPGASIWLRTNQGLPTELVFQVTVVDVSPPRLLRWEGGDPAIFFGRHTWTLTPDGARTQVVDQEAFSGSLADSVLLEQRSTIEAQYQAAMAALKERAESADQQRP